MNNYIFAKSDMGQTKKIIVFLAATAAGGLVFFVSGCADRTRESLWTQISQLTAEKTELKVQNERLEEENRRLHSQVGQLTGMDKSVRLEAISQLEKIELSNRSGLYDRDNDGAKDALMVYIRPVDQTGDTVKTPGHVHVQLWNLDADGAEALIGQWNIEPGTLKNTWAGTFMTDYYRLNFDVKDLLKGGEQELTIKVKFTDYLTGKVCTSQKVIKL